VSETPFQHRFATRACAVCGGTATKHLFRQMFSAMSDSSLLQGYDVVVCQACGFGFADYIPEQSDLDLYYRNMSKYENPSRGGQESPYDLARFQAIAAIITLHLTDWRTRILEIGCATGRLLALLKERGYPNVAGIDPSPTCAAIARNLYGIQVLPQTLSNAVVASQSIDFIILIGVLEHVRDLDTALRRIWTMLSRDGQIIVSVPDASRYAEGEDAPYQEFSLEHINFFGPTSLTNLLSANGFSLVSCEQSLVQSNYRTTTPVIHAVYQKRPLAESKLAQRDTQTEAGLLAYICQSRESDQRIQQKIADVVERGIPIIVWGVGTHTQRLLATSRLAHANIRAFVDSNLNYQGKQLNGIQILAPADLCDRSEPILVSSRVFQSEIVRQIRDELKLENKVLTLYEE